MGVGDVRLVSVPVSDQERARCSTWRRLASSWSATMTRCLGIHWLQVARP